MHSFQQCRSQKEQLPFDLQGLQIRLKPGQGLSLHNIVLSIFRRQQASNMYMQIRHA